MVEEVNPHAHVEYRKNTLVQSLILLILLLMISSFYEQVEEVDVQPF